MKIKKKIVRCPLFLDIYHVENYNKTLKFLHELDNVSQSQPDELVISFMDCRDIKAAAMVLLYAKLEQILQNSQTQISLLIPPFNRQFKELLLSAGFFHLCQHRKSLNDFSLMELPIISGKNGEFREEIIDFIKKQIYKNNFDADLEYVYSDAIQEAINNIERHAYTHSNDEHIWWLNCSLINDELYLVLYDKGQGIPETFVKGNQIYDHIDWQDPIIKKIVQEKLTTWKIDMPKDLSILRTSAFPSDSMSILFAMTDDVTRMTGIDEEKHGQGSKSIKTLVSSHENGILWIFSNRGLFKYIDEKTPPQSYDFNHSINGTLIQWNIKVFK